MQELLEKLHPSAATRGDWFRNIISLRVSEDLFDDLADDADTRELLGQIELDRKPAQYEGRPVLSRPFEEAELASKVFAAIGYPFAHPTASRFSDGTWGVWYGASTLRTTVHETAYHWHRRFIQAPRDLELKNPVIGERRVFKVRCTGALLDLRPALTVEPSLADPHDWSSGQKFGRLLHNNGYPGLLTDSVRTPTPNARTIAVLRKDLLSEPRDYCYLTYRFDPATQQIRVEREKAKRWFDIAVDAFH